MKKLYLICNAHIDPVWQWEWEEGAAAAVSTFRVAADLCEEYDGFVFNHNEALLYRWIEEYEPALFKRIQRLVKEGKWHIMGGWTLQPDCNMPSGEGFVREILDGRQYFAEKFGKRPTTAINFDPFGHTRGLVQILKKSGYDSYLFMRPYESFLPLESNLFTWVGYDGSEIMGQRTGAYNTPLGHAVERIEGTMNGVAEGDFDQCLWGVGDHGGGASRIDLTAIAKLKAEMAEQGLEIVHSTPEAFFAAVKASGKVLPRHEGDLNLWAPGCYTSQVRIKQTYRRMENMLFMTEKMCVAAAKAGMAYPHDELVEAAHDMLFAQFHDFLPGSSIQPVEDMALRLLDHGLEILSRVRARAFFVLASGQPEATEGEIPILVFNPHPYPVEGDFSCEMMLWDQNWDGDFSQPQVYLGDELLPTQCEKEHSNIPLDWRKRVTFHATLQPLAMNRFACRYIRLPQKPAPTLSVVDGHYTVASGRNRVSIDAATGWMDSLRVNGEELLSAPATLDIIADDCDPWGMMVTSFPETVGRFALLSPEEGSVFSGVKGVLPSVRVIEEGPVRVVIEALFGYGHSRAVVRYHISRESAEVQVEVRLQWAEIQKMVKWCVPTAVDNAACIGQVAYGEESLPVNGRENVSQKYIIMQNSEQALAVFNDGVYGSSCDGSTLKVTLLRSAAYTAHPLDDREILPQDRFTPHIDIGERLFRFALYGGKTAEVRRDAARRADNFNEQPMALSFFPCGDGEVPSVPLTLSGETVQLSALKAAEDGNGYIVRLFNPTPASAAATLTMNGHTYDVSFGKYEIVSLRVTDDGIIPCNLIEEAL